VGALRTYTVKSQVARKGLGCQTLGPYAALIPNASLYFTQTARHAPIKKQHNNLSAVVYQSDSKTGNILNGPNTARWDAGEHGLTA